MITHEEQDRIQRMTVPEVLALERRCAELEKQRAELRIWINCACANYPDLDNKVPLICNLERFREAMKGA